MMKNEFLEMARAKRMPLLNNDIVDEDYEILEKLYYILDLDKETFMNVINCITLEKVFSKASWWRVLDKAYEHYNAYQNYKTAKDRLEQYERSVQESKEIIARYEKMIRQS